jgi:hypothetical protein
LSAFAWACDCSSDFRATATALSCSEIAIA